MRRIWMMTAILWAPFAGYGDEPAKDDAQKDKKVETEWVKIGPVQYPIPKTWADQEPSSDMRVAQYGIPKAEGDKGKIELVVFYFQGGGGSVEDNIKRWVGQFKPLDSKEKVEKVEHASLAITMLDATGTYENKPFPMAPRGEMMKDWRMLAAVVETPDEGPYFFRMVGPKASIEAQRESFVKMLKESKTP